MNQSAAKSSDKQVFLFIIVLCLVCGGLLSSVTFILQNPQTEAKELDRNVQMLIAAKVISHEKDQIPSVEALKEISNAKIHPLLVDEKGNVTTFAKENISFTDYLALHKKEGYAHLPLKLFYLILPDGLYLTDEEAIENFAKAESFIFPVSGFGLWASIYGYLAMDSDGITVLGTTWYEHGETPGLGANITEPWWQKQFQGKLLFQEAPNGSIDLEKAPLGLTVVKGKVKDVMGNSPKSKSAVDGMSGATFTGDGLTAAYKNSFAPYRALLIKIHELKKTSISHDNT